MAKRLIDGMSQKSADHIEKFVRMVLDLSVNHWEVETNKRHKEACAAGRRFERDEDDSEEEKAYYASFSNWYSLRQTRTNFEKWLDLTRHLPLPRE